MRLAGHDVGNRQAVEIVTHRMQGAVVADATDWGCGAGGGRAAQERVTDSIGRLSALRNRKRNVYHDPA